MELTKENMNTFIQSTIKSLGGINLPGRNVDFNLLNNDIENKIYLGTYFLRSAIECYAIMTNLTKNVEIFNQLKNLRTIRILDIGSGTGGNILGLVYFLTLNCSKDMEIIIDSIDGNQIALNYQKQFITLFNANFDTNIKLYQNRIVFIDQEDFRSKIKSYLVGQSNKYEIIMTFKFLSEFYNINRNDSDGLFRCAIETVENNLTEKGIFIIQDVVSGGYNKERKFTTMILSNETKQYLQNPNHPLDIILPVSCALWHNKCQKHDCYTETNYNDGNICVKSTCRVFARTQFAQQVIQHYPRNKIYQISFNRFRPSVCSGGRISRIESKVSGFLNNAFSLF